MKWKNEPLKILPGIVKIATEYEAAGRYIDGDHIRFRDGEAEKIGGWDKQNDSTQFAGIARSILAYNDHAHNPWTIVGTHCRLWQFDDDWTKTNITPWESTGSLGADPFATTNGSAVITVTDAAHGVEVGQYVNFAGAATFNGVTVTGEYQVATVIDANSFTIVDDETANATGSGGGGAVTFQYELPCGSIDTFFGGGWGVSTYGTGTYGTVHVTTSFRQNPRFWFLDKYGENVIAVPSGGTVYQWDPDSPSTRAAAVTNAPAAVEAMFVTSERVIVALGVDGDLMTMKWSDDDDITIWTAAITNIANTRTLQEGNRLVGGGRLANRVNMVYSDTAAYLMQFTGTSSVYDTRIVGKNCGLIGPMAHTANHGVAFWMSGRQFHIYNGAVSEVPRSEEIADYVFNRLNRDQAIKVQCLFNPDFNEVWWLYPSTNSDENDSYVFVCLDDFSWSVGSLERTAAGMKPTAEEGVIYMTSVDGYIYEHETGKDADGMALAWNLETGFIEISSGDVSMNVWAYIPNWKVHEEDISLTLTFKDYPQETTDQETLTFTVSEGEGIDDFQASGRAMKMEMSGNAVGSDFRTGKPRISVSTAGKR